MPEWRDIAIQVRAAKRPKAVLLEPDEVVLPFQYRHRVVAFTLPRLHIHAAVKIVR